MANKSFKIFYITLFLFGGLTFGQNLKPGDGVKITLFNIDDSVVGTYYILDNSNLHLPYIGLINTYNKEFVSLKTEIIEEYSKLYRNPEIDVQALYRIDILGEVSNPGVYYLTGFETVTDLIALAGGETSDSNIENIVLIRNDSHIEIDLESFLKGENNLYDIGIESGDKVYVPRTWWVGARDASILVSGIAVLVAVAGLFTK